MEPHVAWKKIGNFRAIRIVRPWGDPVKQVLRLITSESVSLRYVVINFEHEEQKACALFEALDNFVMDGKNTQFMQQMPLGVIKITKNTFQTVRNYIRGGEIGPELPIVHVNPDAHDITSALRALVGSTGNVGLAANKYILMYTVFEDRGDALQAEEFITRLDAELDSMFRDCTMHTFDAFPLGLFVYNNDALACLSNFVARCTHRA